MNKILCCFKNRNKDTSFEIYKIIKYKNIKLLLNCNIIDIYNFVYNKMTHDDYIYLNLDQDFLLESYNSLLNLHKNNNLTVNKIFKNLFTKFLYFYSNNNNLIFNLIIKNNKLFDTNLWLKLILDSELNNDINAVNITSELIKHNIIYPYKPIKFHNLEYNIIEYILIGKIDIKLNKLYHHRFLNYEYIEKFLIMNWSNLLFNKNFINVLYDLDNCDSQNYILKILNLIHKLETENIWLYY